MDPFDARIALSFGMVCAGPPMSGKSSFVLQLIENRDRIFTRQFDYIYYFYSTYTKTIEIIEKEYSDIIKTVKGLPEDIDEYIENDKNLYGLHVFDDLMSEVSNSTSITELTSRKCQHNSISWIVILQNLFFNGGKSRITIQRCAHYMVLFNNPLDKSVIQHLANRIMPKQQKIFLKIFEKASNRPHGYLFIDGRQNTPEIARFRTDIFNYYQRVFSLQ